jgi:hypothetical protein
VELTFGLELEWADVDRHATLPVGSWSCEDYTLVNSDGHANAYRGESWRWGGEINTEPTPFIVGQVGQVELLAGLLAPTINYRCNLHCHVGLPFDLDVAKTLLRFVDAHPRLLDMIEPVPQPTRARYPNPAAYAGAMRRYRRRLVSHHYRLPAARVAEALAADDLDGFYQAHAPLGADGRRLWPVAPRPGINLRSLHKHGTIEFRHFPGSADPVEIGDALRWCQAWTLCALEGGDPYAVWRDGRPWRFPQFMPYEHGLELGYVATKGQA